MRLGQTLWSRATSSCSQRLRAASCERAGKIAFCRSQLASSASQTWVEHEQAVFQPRPSKCRSTLRWLDHCSFPVSAQHTLELVVARQLPALVCHVGTDGDRSIEDTRSLDVCLVLAGASSIYSIRGSVRGVHFGSRCQCSLTASPPGFARIPVQC